MKVEYFLISSLLFFIVSCTPDALNNAVGEDIVILKLTSKKLNKTFTYENSNSQVIRDTLYISPSISDTFQVEVYSKNSNSIVNKTSEILTEKNDHQFFFNPSDDANIAFRYLDLDDNSFPIGLKVEITTGAASKGNLNVILKHQAGIKNGTLDVGTTEINASFILIIK